MSSLQLYTPKLESSALGMALGGHYGGGADFGAEYFADEDMAGEASGLTPQVQRIKANAQAGTFSFGDEVKKKITFVILARQESRIHSAVEGERAAQAASLGYSECLTTLKDWLCYNSDPTNRPTQASLNPRLDENQRGSAYLAGIRGAYQGQPGNQGCKGCPAAAFREEKAPLCKRLESLLVLCDGFTSDPMLLCFGAANAVNVVQRWLPTEFTKAGKQLAWFVKVVQAEWESAKSGGRDILVPKLTVVGLVDPKHFATLKATRDNFLWMMPRNRRPEEEAAIAHVDQVPPPADPNADAKLAEANALLAQASTTGEDYSDVPF